MNFLILEDNFSSVVGFRRVICDVYEGAGITNCDTVAGANLAYMQNMHDILLIDDSVNGLFTGMDFLRLLKKHGFKPKLILCVSLTKSLERHEGVLFDKYTGKDYLAIEKALLSYKSTM